jgi:hypothetical protein
LARAIKVQRKKLQRGERENVDIDDFSPVEHYLADTANYQNRNQDSELWLTNTLKTIKAKAVEQGNQDVAKKAWCFETIHEIQKNYLAAFSKMKEGHFYDGWCLLERVAIAINSLERHFVSPENDIYKIGFLDKYVEQFQTLFPYRMFMSPAFMQLEKECSICGSKISIRNSCGHRKGEIYNGEMCVHIIKKGHVLEISVVTNPVQKYSVLFLNDSETGKEVDHYNYTLVNYVVTGLAHPFDEWEIQKTKIRHPHSLFSHVNPNEKCPCESGKSYKKCCLKEPSGVLRPHMNVVFHSKPNVELPQIVYPNYKELDKP